MSVKYWHLRAVDSDAALTQDTDIILPTGGLTVAYTVCPVKGIDSIFVNFTKCRESPIVDTKKLIRKNLRINEVLTAFQASERKDEAKLSEVRWKIEKLYRLPTHSMERFCYKTGRAEAAKNLHDNGPADILKLEHPISLTIADWVANTLWPLGCDAAGYKGDDMGYAIDVWKDQNGRWVSDFFPSQGVVVDDFGEGCH